MPIFPEKKFFKKGFWYFMQFFTPEPSVQRNPVPALLALDRRDKLHHLRHFEIIFFIKKIWDIEFAFKPFGGKTLAPPGSPP